MQTDQTDIFAAIDNEVLIARKDAIKKTDQALDEFWKSPDETTRKLDEAQESLNARDEGMKKVVRGMDPEWEKWADGAIVRVAERLFYFTADDIADEMRSCPFTTHDKRGMGPVMRRAAKEGIIKATGRFGITRQKKSHGSPAREWQSNIYKGPIPYFK